MARRLDLLEKLCALLEGLPAEKFDYSHWASGTDLHACGTTACALGWATTIPECGLRLEDGWLAQPFVALVGEPAFDSLEAASTAFGIEYDDAEILFDPGAGLSTIVDDWAPKADASAREVAAWIRRHIEAWKAEVSQ